MQELLADKKPKKRIPDLRPGMTVRIHQKIKEGDKERVQVFEGLVIRLGSGTGINKTFTVRNVVSGVGVEKIFPIYSPNIVKIEVRKKAKIRRAKLYYMRERSGKSARLREEYVHDEEEVEKAVEELAEQKARKEREKREEMEKIKTEAEITAPAEKAKEEAGNVEKKGEAIPVPPTPKQKEDAPGKSQEEKSAGEDAEAKKPKQEEKPQKEQKSP